MIQKIVRGTHNAPGKYIISSLFLLAFQSLSSIHCLREIQVKCPFYCILYDSQSSELSKPICLVFLPKSVSKEHIVYLSLTITTVFLPKLFFALHICMLKLCVFIFISIHVITSRNLQYIQWTKLFCMLSLLEESLSYYIIGKSCSEVAPSCFSSAACSDCSCELPYYSIFYVT